MTKPRIEFISKNGRPIGNLTKLRLLCDELKNLLENDAGRWPPHQELAGGPDTIIDDFLGQIEEELDYDPTPRFLYDNSGGEPVMSNDELWQQSFNQKQELHS
jgi:hypothetical protein